MDYYNILGVEKGSSQEEIKRAYRKLAHQFHPDKKGGDEKKFKEINEAYQILGNQEKRAKYDQFGNAFTGDGAGFGGFNGFSQGSNGFAGFDFNNFSNAGFGGTGGFASDLSDIFEGLFNSDFPKKETSQGHNLETTLEINLEDTLKGLEKNLFLDKLIVCQRCEGKGAEPETTLKECFSCRGKGHVQQIKKTILGQITRTIICPECHGDGRIPEKACNVCKGEGRVYGSEEIKVSIPAGIDNGQTIKIQGKGEPGRRGSKPGNLYIEIVVKPHSQFLRKGDDLYIELPITLTESALGAEKEIKALDKKTLVLKVPAGAETGKVLRLKDKGIPHFNSFGKGDLFVQIFIESPKKLTKKQKKLLEELQAEGL
ncbi:MAG: molecular chaperone DnaJ [Parcubacteria group bacterium CG1_02_37_13]|nr:MAG: molecular chaperone DnaJ [Parcubacteria group bacterium CG1_02_37_13]